METLAHNEPQALKTQSVSTRQNKQPKPDGIAGITAFLQPTPTVTDRAGSVGVCPRRSTPFSNTPSLIGVAVPQRRFPSPFSNWKLAHKQFFESLTNLSTAYGLSEDPAHPMVPYPESIRLAYRHAKEQLESFGNSLALRIASVNDNVSLYLYQLLDLGGETFFLPLAPFDRLIQTKSDPKRVTLLDSLFAYLVQVVDLPHIGYGWGYIPSQMEYYAEYQTEQWEEERTKQQQQSHSMVPLDQSIQQPEPEQKRYNGNGSMPKKLVRQALMLWKSTIPKNEPKNY